MPIWCDALSLSNKLLGTSHFCGWVGPAPAQGWRAYTTDNGAWLVQPRRCAKMTLQHPAGPSACMHTPATFWRKSSASLPVPRSHCTCFLKCCAQLGQSSLCCKGTQTCTWQHSWPFKEASKGTWACCKPNRKSPPPMPLLVLPMLPPSPQAGQA